MSLFLFPGQGSQRPGMGSDFYEQSPAARAIFDQAATLTPEGFLECMFTGEEETIGLTRHAQPALLTVEVAIAAHLAALGVVPSACAGHSLGEIPALVVAGACDFADALRFTQERARLMSEEVPEGGMAAVMGLAPEAIDAVLPEGVQVANYNTPDQTIITGASAPLEAAAELLKAAGAKRVMPLKVSGPFHSEFMRDAAERLRAVLEAVPFLPPRTRFISSVTGREERDPDQIRGLLSVQLVRPVRWTQVMQCFDPAGQALEIGPGGVLKGLAKRIPGAPRVSPAGNLDDVQRLLSEACSPESVSE